jgi:hypothetical protein
VTTDPAEETMAPTGSRGRSLLRLAGAAALSLALLFAPQGAAATVPGAGEPDFDVALRAWLADNDAAALPALAELAAEGNAAAQLLLSLIDRMPETHSEWLADLGRGERRALMRTTEGRSWMEAASREAPLALHWLALWRADTDPEVAIAFAELGEMRAARLVLLAHAARERGGFAALATDPLYPPELVWLALAEEPDAEARAVSTTGLHPGDPQRARLGAPAPDPEALARWLAEAPLAAPIAAFCSEACGEDVASCSLAAYEALGGYRGLFALGSPSETLIPEEQWLASAKGAQSVPRRIKVLDRPAAIEDSCLARFVED